MNYIPTIGLEVHVQLNTNTKIFCGCKTSFGDPPNVHICPVCLGLPGALPVLNNEVLKKAVLAGLAIKAEIHKKSKFDRKNYFYPDLPKAYQISQFDEPYCTNGVITIEEEGRKKDICIIRIHMEEDAGKLMHSEDSNVQESYVDLNRAGTPLIEIVSAPEIDSSDEAVLYLTQLKSIMQYIEISDCNMEQGSLRVDANISVRPEGQEKLGTRAEIKNLNSFKAVKAAIDYEIERQIDLINSGEKVLQETRLWNAVSSRTVSMRSKEESHDYRYFPEPDLVPVVLTDDEISAILNDMPELAYQKKERFVKDYSIPEYDAGVLTAKKEYAEYYENLVKKGVPAKKASNWLMAEMLAFAREKDLEFKDLCSFENLSALLLEIESGTISGKIAKTVFAEMIETNKDPLQIIKEKGLVQITDENAIVLVVEEVLKENQESVQSFLDGKDKALGFLVGQVMKKTQGKANPPLVNKLLLERLKK